MRNFSIIITILLNSILFTVKAQDFRYELINSKDSIKSRGLEIYLEIDSVYEINSENGIQFAIIMNNKGSEVINFHNPFYDTKRYIHFGLFNIKSKERVILKQISRRQYIPKSDFKPFSLEKVIISDSLLPKAHYFKYWEKETLSIEPNHQIRFELNLYEQITADEKNNMLIVPLTKGDYYAVFIITINIDDDNIETDTFRLKLNLK